MTTTPLLALPLLAAAQAQKHVTLNEALMLADALMQIAVKEQGRNAPPDAPAAGDRYLIGAAPAGAFAGKAGMIAAFDGTQWIYTAPRAGFIIYVASENRLFVHDGTILRNVKEYAGPVDSVAQFGVGTGVDPNNVLSVKGMSALFAALGTGSGGTGNFRFNLNKDLASNTLSQIYQTAWSGRAETGLMGDDQYRIKVSPDGATWFESFGVDHATGSVRLPAGLSQIGGGGFGFRNCVLNPDFAIAQRGPGPFTLSGAVPAGAFDRWRMIGGTGVGATLSRTANSIANAASFSGAFYATFAASAATVTTRAILETRLEHLLPLAGKRVTLSFKYRANAAFFVSLVQNFGVGGSAAVSTSLTSNVGGSANWRSISLPVVLPAVTGKTLGTSPFLALQFALPQASFIDLADVQLEEGYATPFERRPPGMELSACRRFFRRSASALNSADLAYEMRIAPAVTGAGPYDYDSEFEAA